MWGFVASTCVALSLVTWAWGGSASNAALHRLYQRYVDRGPVPGEVEGVVEHRRVPLPLLQYYETQGTFDGGKPLGCPSQRSLVLWYGVGARVLWQEGHLLPTGDEWIRDRGR